VKHLYRTHALARERGEPSIFQAALDHLAAVNGWEAEEVRTYLAEVRAEYLRREALRPWSEDLSGLDLV
jgi:hypothetical protein